MAPKEMNVPSLAQTHMQAPLNVNGSGKPLTRDELDLIKSELIHIKNEYNLQEPTRSFMDDVASENWRFGGKPDYSLTNYKFLTERTKNHPEGSLELIVENLVKTWEMERSHKLDPATHQSVDTVHFQISANGGKVYNNVEANAVGNYNVLLDACPAELWDKSNISWEESHSRFHTAFAAFPWEVLDVFSGPPKVAFTWRHWGHFTGTYEENKGKGELIEMFGFGTAEVNAKLQLTNVEIFFDAKQFIEILRGHKKLEEDINTAWGSGSCPHFAKLKQEKLKKEKLKEEDVKKEKQTATENDNLLWC